MGDYANEIVLDLPLTMQKVDQINELVYRLKKMTEDIDQVISVSSDCWRGEAANTYRSSCEMLKSNMMSASDRMANFSYSIRQTAQDILIQLYS